MQMTPEETLEAMRAGKQMAGANQQTIFNSYVDRTFFFTKRALFYYWNSKVGEYQEFSETLLLKILIGEGFFDQIYATRGDLTDEEKKKIKGLTWLNFLHKVIRDKSVEWAGELAGYPCGEHVVGGIRLLITKTYKLIELVEGDDSFVWDRIHQLLPGIQADFFLAWLQDRMEGLYEPQKYTPGQAMIIGGMIETGKTWLRTLVVIPALGGRAGCALAQLTGADSWNDDIVGKELHWIDDQGESMNVNRAVFTSNVKTFVSVPEIRIRTRYQSAMTVPIKAALLILFNLEVKNFALLPEPSGDIDDKVIVLKSAKADFPSDREEIVRRTQEALPAFLYRLRYLYKAPAGVRNNGRYKIEPYKDPDIQAGTIETGHAGQIQSLLQRFLLSMAAPKMKIKGNDLYFAILEDPKHRISLEKICKSAPRFVQLLGSVAKISGSGVTRPKSHKDRVFFLELLEFPETPEGTIPFGSPGNLSGSEEPKGTRKKNQPSEVAADAASLTSANEDKGAGLQQETGPEQPRKNSKSKNSGKTRDKSA